MKAIIISGGYVNIDFAKDFLKNNTYDYLIACDKGLETVDKLKVKVDLILGDFDSVNSSIIKRYEDAPETRNSVKRFKPEKDFTDTHLAVENAINAGAKEIIILGATGTRLDHVLGNIALLSYALDKFVKVYIVDEYNRISMIEDSLQICANKQYGNYVSLIPYGGNVEGLYLTGFKYNVEGIVLNCSESMGISNEIVEDNATITIKKGRLLVVEARQE